MKLLEMHAREMLGMSQAWGAFRFKAMPQEAGKVLYYEVTGAVAPLVSKGSCKGNRNWKRRDRATERVANIPVADHDAWTREWERQTGKCSNCVGEGKVMARWHYKEGMTYKTCPICLGSGKAEWCKECGASLIDKCIHLFDGSGCHRVDWAARAKAKMVEALTCSVCGDTSGECAHLLWGAQARPLLAWTDPENDPGGDNVDFREGDSLMLPGV